MDLGRLHPWIVRTAWAVLPFAAGPALAAALDGRSVAVRTVASGGLWAAWATALCASLVLHPIALTVLRCLAPAAVAGAAWAAVQGEPSGLAGSLGVAAALVAFVVVFLPETGVAFVNGPAYPNERRFPLRVPGPLLLGPLFLAWALTIGAPVAGALLLAAQQWVAGGVAVAVGAAAVFVLGRALHGLSRRWVVFVPAGLVLHDPMTLADPVLFPKLQIATIDLADVDTTALDLTQRSPGLAVELALRETASLVLTKPGQRIGPTVDADRVLFTPTRPGAVLREARERMGSGAPPPVR